MPIRREMPIRRALTLLAVTALARTGVRRYVLAQARSAAPQYRLASGEGGFLTVAAAAAGALNAAIAVQEGSQVSGQTKQLLAEFNSVVKKGQLIARVDPQSFLLDRELIAQSGKDTAQTVYDSAVAQIEATRALVSHEPDVAASASRFVTFRDGTVLHDWRVASASHAADAFAAPPSEAAR